MEEPDTLPCTDKLAFDTKAEAMAAATTANWRYGSSPKVYKCSHCKLWHLASSYDNS